MEAAGLGASAGGVASMLVDKLTYMLGIHIRTAGFKDPSVILDICLSLARGIDHAVGRNEVPSKSHDIPLVLKQVYRCKNDLNLQAALMILMMSVKSACQVGWFPNTEKDDLLMMAKELGGYFSDTDSMRSEPTYANPFIRKIMLRFYPKMNMDRILASFDVKPGYGAHVLDFYISKGMVDPQHEKMWLFVARTDNFDTSSCIVSPPDVSFLVNTMGVPGRTKTNMCNGPQLPTNVTTMLKFGVNLLQAVGNFNGSYFIAIAIMSFGSAADVPPLQDYVEPVSTSVDSDCEVIEMSSRISLNCPISLRRLRTPAKGYRCKHLQCFDVNNYLKLNLKRPSWRCPQCNQPVCFPDIRIDQKIAKVLSEVGENVVDVIISADGSWKPVLENDEHYGQTSNITSVKDPEKIVQSEASGQTILTSTAAGNHLHLGVDNMHQNLSFVLQCSTASASAHNVDKISSTAPLSTLGQLPVQTDVISQTHQESCGQTQAVFSSFHNQFYSYNSQYQQPDYSTYWRLPPININRQLSEYQRAMLPPPGYPQMPSFCQNSRNLDPLLPTGASFAMSSTFSSLPQYGTLNRGMDTQLQPSWSYASAPSISATGSYLRQHHSANQGTSSIVHSTGAHGTVVRPRYMQQNRHHPYHLNSDRPQASCTFQNVSAAFVHAQPQEVQIEGATPLHGTSQRGQSKTPSVPFQPTLSSTSSGDSLAMVSDQLRGAAEQRQNNGKDGLAAMASENQCPSGRMRGSLRGEFAAAYRQSILQPPQQSARLSQPSSNRVPANPGAPLIHTITPNIMFTRISNVAEEQSHQIAQYATDNSGSLPAQSQGTH